jgi:hypothetical protein
LLIKFSLTVALLVLLSAWSSGCIWLAVPSLAYEGYKYEHPSKASSTQAKAKSSSSQPQPSASSDHSIE